MRLFFFVILLSCATQEVTKQKEPVQKVQMEEKTEPFNYEPMAVDIFNGKIKYVSFDTDLKDGAYEIKCGQKIHMSEVKDKVLHMYLSESYFSKPQKKKCFLNNNHVLDVTVKAFNYKKERLNVPKRRVDLNKKDLARVIKEKEIKKNIYKKSASYYLFDKPFTVPLKSKITSVFGNQRLFNNKKRSQHLGNDLRAAVGVPIKANNRGQVVFTGDLFFSGKLVVIDHGLNLFTTYMHLSKILVEKGAVVNQGDVVGHAGMTGRVSGPHLHWGVRLNGSWMDGFTLVEESKKHIANYASEE